MKLMFRSVIAVVLIIVVSIAGLVAYVLTLDANQFRDDISRIAARQDIQLDIRGDLSLAIWPEIRILVADVGLQTAAVSGDLDEMSLALQLGPLLKKQIEFSAVELQGARLQLLETGSMEDQPSDTRQAALPDVRLDRLSIKDSQIALAGVSPQRVYISGLELTRLNNRFESSEFVGEVEYSSAEASMKLSSLRGEIWIDADNLEVSLRNASGSVTTDNFDQPIELQLLAHLGLSGLDLVVDQFKLSFAAVDLSGSVAGNLKSLALKGQVETGLFDGYQVLDDFGLWGFPAGTLRDSRLSALFSFEGNELALDPLRISFDESEIQSGVRLTMAAVPSLEIQGSLNRLNLDAYLPAEEAETGAGPDAKPGLPELPVHKLSANLTIGQLSAAGFAFSDATLRFSSDQQSIRIDELTSGFVGGQLGLTGRLGLGSTLSHQLSFQASNLMTGEILSALTGRALLTGRLNADYQAVATGSDFETMLTSLNGTGRVSATELILQGVDIEGQVCDISDRIQRQSLVSQYGALATSTRLADVSAQLVSAQGITRLNGLVLAIGNIQSSGQGQLNLLNKELGLTLQARLAGDKTSETGCTVNRYLRDRTLPLQCSGTLGAADFGCGIDNEFLQHALQSALTQQLRNQLLPQSDDEEKPPAQQLIEGILRRAFP